MEPIIYVNVETKEDINLSKITINDLSKRYRDKNGKVYAIRYIPAEHKLEIVNVKIIFENEKELKENKIDGKVDNTSIYYDDILKDYGIKEQKKKKFFNIFDKKEIIFIPEFILHSNNVEIINAFKDGRKLDLNPTLFLYDWNDQLYNYFANSIKIIHNFLYKIIGKNLESVSQSKNILESLARNISLVPKIIAEIFVEESAIINTFFNYIEREQTSYITDLKSDKKKIELLKIFAVNNKVMQICYDMIALVDALYYYFSLEENKTKYIINHEEDKTIEQTLTDFLYTLKNYKNKSLETIKNVFSIYQKIAAEKNAQD